MLLFISVKICFENLDKVKLFSLRNKSTLSIFCFCFNCFPLVFGTHCSSFPRCLSQCQEVDFYNQSQYFYVKIIPQTASLVFCFAEQNVMSLSSKSVTRNLGFTPTDTDNVAIFDDLIL